MKKKIAALLMSVLLVLSAVPVFAEGEDSVYRSLYSGEIGTLNYLTTSSENEYSVAANIVDTLVEHDTYGQIVPCLAESWEQSEDGLTWTFHLRDGATWVTADGTYYADVTAEDFVTAAKYILNAQNASSTAWILTDYIVGAQEYFDSTSTPDEGEEAPAPFDWENVGVKAIDDKTIAYTTSEPCPYFLSMLDYVCYMPVNAKFLEEKGDQFGLATGNDTVLYCGAYTLSEFKPQEKRVFSKNESYWDAEHVYLTKLEQTYNKEASTLSPELYLRGEIDSASITSTIAAEWLADEKTADLIHPVRQVGQYSYFFCFNFDPQFDEVYEPENWKIAVNNENFRQSIMSGLDRVKAKTVIEPDNPEDLLWDTVTPSDIVIYDGQDYTEMGALADVKVEFNEEKAKAYRDAAIPELTEAGATLPIKVLMCYNPSDSSWAEECQVIEQQLEGLLGSDYIDIIVEPGPSSGFLKEIRRSGKYAFMKCNWGLDFADPINTCEPFSRTDNYGFLINATQESLYDDNGEMTYYNLTDAAREMSGSDMEARYLAFAEAEAYLINHALTIPYGSNTGGYTASRLNPFESQFAATGLATCRYKGQHLLEKPMSTDEFYDAYDEWLEKRAELAGK